MRSATPADQVVLGRWIFSVLSTNSKLGNLTNLTEAQRQIENKTSATLCQRLLFVDCHNEAVQALKYEGQAAFEASFGTLGEVAIRGLMSDPAVGQEMARFGSYFDPERSKAFRAEAGGGAVAAPK